MLPENSVLDIERSPENFDELMESVDTVEHERTSLESMNLETDGTLTTPSGTYRVTRDFLEQTAKAIEMPLGGYAYKISPELFRENFAKQKSRTNRPVTVCSVDDVAVGLVAHKTKDNHRYRPASSIDVLQTLANSEIFDRLQFRRASVSYQGFDLELVRKDLLIQPVLDDPTDEIEVGFAMSNSESAGRHLKAEAYAHRVICTNGARMTERLGVARWLTDPRMTVSASMMAFERDLEKLVLSLASVEKMYERIHELVPDVELVNLWRRIAYGVSRKDADEIIGLSVDERKSLQETLAMRPIDEAPKLTDFNVFDIHNQVTDAAHNRRLLVSRKLQEIGGDFLQRSLMWTAV